MRILWIEDDPEINAELFFGKEILRSHDVLTIRDFEEAHKAIANNLEQFDYVVIDLNLEKSSIGEQAKKLMNDFELKKSQFLEEAGFHIYIQLMEKGFPKERIVFFTANTASAKEDFKKMLRNVTKALSGKNKPEFNSAIKALKQVLDGKHNSELNRALKLKTVEKFIAKLEPEIKSADTRSTFEDIELHFGEARINIPNEAISKQNKDALDKWFMPRLNFENTYHEEENLNLTKNYLSLRRGILNVLNQLEERKTKLTSDFFNKDGAPHLDKLAFIEGLRWLLQAHDLSQDQAGKFYFMLCDYMTKPFELFSFGKLKHFSHNENKKNIDNEEWRKKWMERRSSMIPPYFLRNWIAHGLISGSKNTPDFTSRDVGFIFLLVIKSMFNVEMYGNKGELKSIFGDLKRSFKSIRSQVLKFHQNDYARSFVSEKLDIIESLGQKNEKHKANGKLYWKNQNFISHFYASYLLASSNLLKNYSNVDQVSREKEFKVNLTYELTMTKFLEIASKRHQEINK